MFHRHRRKLLVLALLIYIAVSAAANLGAFGPVAAQVSMAVVLIALLAAFLRVASSSWQSHQVARRTGKLEG